MSVRQRKGGDNAPPPPPPPNESAKDDFDAPAKLETSIYDTQNLDIPPTVATPRVTPTALESEVSMR
uniref:Uncharacterized protein n=1 Tax=Syphacia muris TaxID=451379 RepID=A0A0N5AU69_9BILA